ncbi:helix-turn-helix domain-containing protein [Butyricimonas hominis]|jgi:transcriptional regulator, XRE family|uniref:Helix-turn-helix transcriptional regulator n=1 Tax=Butyricimonas hominis TaxID=2763032 RepID=A0ABR7D4D4_9BACT|nr:helix-turn-helix transcriptional regulator [Butyricimonas hominis]MBC5622632.1 helix-turn-helix transcriptional regulator [Butyricimonas hominis]
MEITKKPKEIKKTEIELFIINKVKELREAKKIGQKRLSLELKLSISYVGQAEDVYNDAKYNFNHLNEIARFFNVPFSYFFPEFHLEKDCIEDYLEKHPKVKARYEKMAKNYEEKERKKLEEKERKKAEKAAAKKKAVRTKKK